MSKYITAIEKAIKTKEVLEKIMVSAMLLSMILAFISFPFYIAYDFLLIPVLNTIGFVFAITFFVFMCIALLTSIISSFYERVIEKKKASYKTAKKELFKRNLELANAFYRENTKNKKIS